MDKKKVKYEFEYCVSTPFWVDGDNLDYEHFNIHPDLVTEIKDIDRVYQSTYNKYDGRESQYKSWVQAGILAKRILFSAELLRIELGQEFELDFDSEYWAKVVEKMFKENTG